jgi:hypothetical protein
VSRVKGFRDIVLQDFADNVVRLTKINLGKTYTAKNSKGKTYKKRIDSFKRLRDSVEADLKVRTEDGRFSKGFVVFQMLEYGIYVDKGRKKGKGIPSKPLIDWINKKPVRLRDYKTGSFIKKTDARVESLAFLISRNAKKHGIEPTNFFKDAYESQEEKFYQQLQEAVAQDNIDYISQRLDLISKDGGNT